MVAPPLDTERLLLTPLRVEDAQEMATILAEPEIYDYIDDEPLTAKQLSTKYKTQTSHWNNEKTKWRNWVVRLKPSKIAIGYIQATIKQNECILAWVISPRWQGNGYAVEATKKIIEKTHEELDVTLFSSEINKMNIPSKQVARNLRMNIVQEGPDAEEYWTLQLTP